MPGLLTSSGNYGRGRGRGRGGYHSYGPSPSVQPCNLWDSYNDDYYSDDEDWDYIPPSRGRGRGRGRGGY